MSETIIKPPISMPLTTADRCDRCGAAARVRAVLSTGSELLFCRHHFNEHEARLVDMGATVIMNEEELV